MARRLLVFASHRGAKTQGGSSHTKDAKRKFVVTDYRTGEDGALDGVLPARCIGSEDGEACQIWRHDWRERVDGPGHRLRIVRCVTHGVYFTLYPPGFTPWGRRPVADDDVDETVFGPALEAATGCLWPRHKLRAQDDGRYALAQRRHIRRAAQWLGLVGADGQADQVSQLLEIPSLATHQKARMDFEQARSRGERGEIVACILEAIPHDSTWTRRLLGAGTATQIFDVVYRVGADKTLERLPAIGPNRSPRGDPSGPSTP